MTKPNPYISALLAVLHIGVLVMGLSYATAHPTPQESALIPMIMLGLFVLSAAVMGYLFVFQPGRMYLEGAKTEAIKFFAKTVGTFAVVIAVLIIIFAIF